MIMPEVMCDLAQPLPVPLYISFLTKELCSHVVIHPDNALRTRVKETGKLQTDKPAGTGNNYTPAATLTLIARNRPASK
jgi:hypothetical protein